MSFSEFNYRFKLSVLGDAGVGKSTLLKQFTTGKCDQKLESTIGVETSFKLVEVVDTNNDLKVVRVQLWDSSGDVRFRHLLRACYTNVRAVVLVYDITRTDTFLDLLQWEKELQQHCDNSGEQVVKLVIGNKADLAAERVVDEGEARRWAAERDMLYEEISANDKAQVDASFTRAINKVFVQLEEEEQLLEAPTSDPFCQMLRVFCFL